jgi:hypothetical protein
MWENWQPEVVSEDLKQLSASGMQVLRVFPLWPVFQPLVNHWHAHTPVISFSDRPLGVSAEDKAGISVDAMKKFEYLLDQAELNGLKLIVGLLTGWMSGRLFVPPAFEKGNALRDPEIIKWEVRFVRYFVNHFKGHPAIAAWDLGNECNCMGKVETSDEAWLWTNTIASAIRLEDSKPVISGMHSLRCENHRWIMFDQGELTDILTTHPYPRFTPKCEQDQINTIRNGLHATVESRFYADISGKPCFPEELGTLGPVVCSEKNAAAYLRTTLYSSWAHDCRSLLWWCAYDQDHLDFPPYEWVGLERELGLIRNDRSEKPVLGAMAEFRKVIEALPFKTLPKFKTDAVCVLTRSQDQWSAAYASFILAKMASFDIKFQFTDQLLEDAPLYIVPSVKSSFCVTRSEWLALLEKAANGATIFMTYDDAFLQPFEKVIGAEVEGRELRNDQVRFNINGKQVSCARGEAWLKLIPTTAEVLIADEEGWPVLLKNNYGSGKILFLNVPLETSLSDMPGVFNRAGDEPFWELYKLAAKEACISRVVTCDNPQIGVTEHYFSDNEMAAVIINYSNTVHEVTLKVAEGWVVDNDFDSAEMTANSCRIIMLKKR